MTTPVATKTAAPSQSPAVMPPSGATNSVSAAAVPRAVAVSPGHSPPYHAVTMMAAKKVR